ncbi:MAG TPA: MBL fold metallo-hydrolase [Thermoleophilaceae bacterium]|nr:MBL fold metallo-hydrolase [Thermoleophilaceae bacterium]
MTTATSERTAADGMRATGGVMRVRPRLARLVADEPEKIAEGVWIIRGGLGRAMNVYFIEDKDGLVMYDAGEEGMAAAVAVAAARMGGLKQIVLGHGDFDHRGTAPSLSAVPVYCHPDAVGPSEGDGGRGYMDFGKLPLWIQPLYTFAPAIWDGGPVKIAGTVQEGDRIAGFEVIELAGHAPGLIGLWRESDRLALVTDCFYMTDPVGRRVPPTVPHEAFNLDTERARESIRKLARLEPRSCWPGHRGPLTGDDVREQLERAAEAPAR